VRLEGFGAAFTQAFFMILATEIGDRTFFIAAIMAMRNPRLVIWSSAIAALVLMTLISCIFGMTAIVFVPKEYVHWAVVAIMFFFGLQLLRNGFKMDPNEGFDDLEELESDERLGNKGKDDEENFDIEKAKEKKSSSSTGRDNIWKRIMCFICNKPQMSAVALQAFTLTFLAEWGDRSQLATIALSASNPPLGVLCGGIIGHSMCTGLAVIGGRLIANYVSERTVTLAGGSLFLAFGLYGAFIGPQ